MPCLTAAILLVIGIGVPSEQVRPSFSGAWARDDARSGSAAPETNPAPVVWEIQESSDAVVIDRKRGERVARFTYAVGEKRPTPRHAAPTVAPTADAPGNRAYWDGDRLVLETLQDIQGKTVTTREVLTLAPDGRELVVARVVEVEHGYTMKGAQSSNAATDVFVRRQ
jgi:hypothetical protein